MLIRNLLGLVLSTLIICSCNRKTSSQSSETNLPTKIDVTTSSDSVVFNLSYLATDIEYIPLKTIERISVFKIVASSDRIYIDIGMDLLCYSNKGNFQYKLSSGIIDPEVTLSFIDDFDISSDDSTLVVLSYNQILIFKNTGTEFIFQNSIVLKRPFPSLISLVPGSKEILLSYKPVRGSEPLLSLLINSDGDTLAYRPNRYKYKLPLMLSDRINHYKTGDYLCFNDPYCDTIFYVSKDLDYFKTRLILDSKERTYYNWNKRKGVYVESEYSEYYSVERVFELSGKIIYNNSVFYPKMTQPFQSMPYNITRKIIYNPLTSKKIEIPFNSELVDDLRGGPDFKPSWISYGNLYASVYVTSLKKHIESDYFVNVQVQNPQKKEEFKNLVDSIKVNDNTVLIVVTLKDSFK